MANIDAYLRVLSIIKLHETGFYTKEQLEEDILKVFDNRAILMEQIDINKRKRGLISISPKELLKYLSLLAKKLLDIPFVIASLYIFQNL
ncbi:hypothetical protein [Campylobacter pinnipediorum]|uniref:hypothetical protein n=1 Tax=Campylobacter pinnipediorum TaxID=1965231 RepID=UPI00112FC364|nr:hypothetical protein [Campylobacter pinnipediorum]